MTKMKCKQVAEELQMVDISLLFRRAEVAFFLNLHNALMLHTHMYRYNFSLSLSPLPSPSPSLPYLLPLPLSLNFSLSLFSST